jgi:transcriptional regulator with XRE-family HTH domain
MVEIEILLRRRFAARLREAMDAKGWNQTELGKRVGLSQSSVSDMLGLQKKAPALPNARTLSDLCRELRVSADWLLGLGRNPQGGMPSAGESYQDGGLAAIIEIRLALETLEGRWRGDPTILPTVAERSAGAEHVTLARELAAGSQTRRRVRRRGA